MLSIDKVTIGYGTKNVLNDFSVHFNENKITGVIGPNGAGKSTILKAILGLIKIKKGQINFNNQKINNKILATSFSYVPQKTDLDINFPIDVFNLVAMGNKQDKELIAEKIKELQIEDIKKKSLSEISGGQLQRALVARALVKNAEVYILDEPFNGIDANSEEIIIKALKKIRDQKKTVIVVNHNIDKINQYFDEIILMNHHLIFQGKPDSKTKEKIFDVFGGIYD